MRHSLRLDLINKGWFFSLTQSDIPNYVYTGVVINYRGKIKSFTQISKVFMATLTDEEIEAYVDTGEPMYEKIAK